ncbi:MAG: hypothetical protein KDA32_14290 [Phycisphaerales bacterium]|nr:hypothetical protein [Phycisphaerales bacterium]MCA9288622.1 hypothetical protein [Phycisphaerales bacterium]
MASAKRAVEDAGKQFGLQIGAMGVAYGEVDGYLVQLTPGIDARQPNVVVQLLFDVAGRDQVLIKNSIAADPAVQGADFAAKRLQIVADRATYTQPANFVGSFSGDKLRDLTRALVAAMKNAAPPPPVKCEHCETTESVPPRLVNGAVTRVCEPCIAKLRAAAQAAQAAYDAQPTRLGLAILAAAGTAILGGLVWAGIGIATGSMYAMVGIGAGLLVGFATLAAAGKGNLIVQGITFVATVSSALLGQIFWGAFYFDQAFKEEGLDTDWGQFVQLIPRLLWKSGGDTVFALACGVIGAAMAVGITKRQTVEMKVD